MLSEQLKRLRERHDYTKKYISSLLNISPSAYSFYETGRNMPSIKAISTLAELYNVSIDYLLEHKQAEKKMSKEIDFVTDMFDDLRKLTPQQQQQVSEYIRLLKLDNALHLQPAKKRTSVPKNATPTMAAFGGGVHEMDAQKLKELAAYKKSLENIKKE